MRQAEASEAERLAARRGARPQQIAQSASHHPMLHLQDAVGNRGAQRFIQAKRQTSHPRDPSELEADRIAERAVDGHGPVAAPVAVAGPALQRTCACAAGTPCGCDGAPAQPLIARHAEEAGAMEAPDGLLDGLGPGEKLDAPTRRFMESRLKEDFSEVRVHRDARADSAARKVQATAFTSGRDIVFRANRYAPSTREGRKLIAHELVHTVQQKRGGGEGTRVDRQVIPNPFGDLPNPFKDFTLPDIPDPRKWIPPFEIPWNPFKSDPIIPPLPIPIPGLPKTPKPTGCTPASGVPPTTCGAYAANRYWLPDAYVHNATCACSTTPNNPRYNSIRKTLQDLMASAPSTVVATAASLKAAATGMPPNPVAVAAWEVYVDSTLLPMIYAHHVAAYARSCCTGGPAAYPAWVGVTHVPLPCSAVGMSIRFFGPCSGIPGVW